MHPSLYLHPQIAPASVTETLGNKIDIWMVSNLPVGLYKSTSGTAAAAEKTYFLRAHVLAGNAELANKEQVEEFQWLTKEEIEKLMEQSNQSNYWNNVEDLLDP